MNCYDGKGSCGRCDCPECNTPKQVCAPPARQLYFAFGMNMDPRTMLGYEAAGAAYADGYRLEFLDFADIVPADGEQVPGVTWHVTERELARLDGREGCNGGVHPTNLYDRVQILIRFPNHGPPTRSISDRVELAWAYRMTERTRAYAGEPSEHYLDMMRRGRRAFGLPTDDLPAERNGAVDSRV